MTSILNNFVAITPVHDDLLSPKTYRSVVDLIRGIQKQYDLSGINAAYQKLIAHINNFDDPHLDNQINFLGPIVSGVYNVYVNMTPTPLSKADFYTQIVPSLDFLELFRRVILNRYLYNSVKAGDGSVPASATVYLTSEWYQSGTVTLNFGRTSIDEVDFIKLGWNGNVTPFNAVFSAIPENPTAKPLPVIFETSSNVPYISAVIPGSGIPFFLNVASNSFSIVVKMTGVPTTPTTLFSLSSQTDTVTLVMNPNQTYTLTANGQTVLTSAAPSLDNQVIIESDASGTVSLNTHQAGVLVIQKSITFLTSPAVLSSGMILVGYDDPAQTHFGLNELTVFSGTTTSLLQPSILVPDGYNILIDPDGAVLFDNDGTPLMEYDLTVPVGYFLVTDNNGLYTQDSNGAFIIDTNYPYYFPTVPAGYSILQDADGSILLDPDGSFLIDAT